MSNKSDILRRYELRPFEMTQRDIENSRIGYEDMIFGKRRKALKAKRKRDKREQEKGQEMKLRNKKTGKVIENACIGVFKHQSSGDCERIDTEARSLEKVLEEWEDYKPKEPLIKDERVRKAVRAWAEASDVGVAKVAPFAVFDIESSARIYFYGRVIEDKDYDEKKSYTIAELCGEEEE